MNCQILRTLYVRANGEIPCEDDFGERLTLGWLPDDPATPAIGRILENEAFGRIRAAFARGEAPWPEVCRSCALLRPDEAPVDELGRRVIEKLQIESSLACALRCPDCSNLEQIRHRKGPLHMTPEVFAGLLGDLRNEGFAVRSVEYCGQGEPLNNPRFPGLLATARRLYPEALQRVITNGNHDYADRIGDAFLEETVVSVDGAPPDAYARYRVNGRIDRALAFLRDAVAAQRPRGGAVIWKYILLASNDSDVEIAEAGRLAEEIGVTELRFVRTHSASRSIRAELPRLPAGGGKVRIEAHPSFFRNARSMAGRGGVRISGAGGAVHLDSLTIHEDGTLRLVGWANAAQPVSEVTVAVDGAAPEPLPLTVPRPDVRRQMPVFVSVVCGFDVWVRASAAGSAGPTVLEFRMVMAGGGTSRLLVDFEDRPLPLWRRAARRAARMVRMA